MIREFKSGNYKSKEKQEKKAELSPEEKRDIDQALLNLKEARKTESAEMGERADAIILSYGPRALNYLEEKRDMGDVSGEDLRYFKSRWWDHAYSDDASSEYGSVPAGSYALEDEGFSATEQEYAQQGGNAFLNFLKSLSFFRQLSYPELSLQEYKEKEDPADYQFFTIGNSRQELFQYCKAVVEFLRMEKIPNIIIMDRSARPFYVAIREYWGAKYPNEKMPGIYFMNPKGFKAREDLTSDDILAIMQDCQFKGDAIEPANHVRTRQEILDEVDKTYTELAKVKDQPVLIFDTCLHSGRTLKPVLDTLKQDGFTHVLLGSINPSPWESVIKTDFSITRKPPDKGCYPFDVDRLIEKTFNHAYSKRTTDAFKRTVSKQLREEIRRIIKEEMAK